MDRGALVSPPNLLSFSRFFLAALFLLLSRPGGRLVVLALAALTDLLDGWLARRTGMATRWGALLDPIADRVFVLAAVVVYLAEQLLTPLQLVLFLARDLATTLGFFVARAVPWLRPVEFKARWAGKAVTALQLAALVVILLWPTWTSVMVTAIALFSAVAIADYTRALWRARVR